MTVKPAAAYMATTFGAKVKPPEDRQEAASKPKKPAKPSKPMTTAERRARDFERVQMQPEAAGLAANAEVKVEPAKRASTETGERGNVERARRMDAFEALRPSMVKDEGAYDAARRLENDVLIRRGWNDRGASITRVDNDKLISPRQYAMVEAGSRVDAVLELLPRREAWLLMELITPTAPVTLAATSWRGVVEYVTGETHKNSQGTVVRAACVDLAEAYVKLDNMSRRAA